LLLIYQIRKIMQHHEKTEPKHKVAVHFTSPDENEQHDLVPSKFCWNKVVNSAEQKFPLYFGVLRESHQYTVTLDITFEKELMDLEVVPLPSSQIPDLAPHVSLDVIRQDSSNAKLTCTYAIIIKISSKSMAHSFEKAFELRNSKDKTQKVHITVSGKILRKGQGTPYLKENVHEKKLQEEIEEEDDK